MMRFTGDRTRNRVRDGKLEVSAIFKWFKEDFDKGHKGVAKVEDAFVQHAPRLTDNPDQQARLRDKAVAISHLDCDGSLNAIGQ